MKKTFIRLLFLGLFLVIGLFIYIPLKLHDLESQVSHYLVNEKQINPAQIATLTGRIGKLPLFSVEVTFTDEPDVRYMYREKNGSIIQIGYHSQVKKDEGHYKYLE